MRQFIYCLVAFTLLSCCNSQPPYQFETSSWKNFGYEGMAGKINRLAGPASANCGIHNHVASNDYVNQQISIADSRTCIKNAIEKNIPFRYGSIQIPVDSFLFKSLVLSDKREFWLIDYDSMIDGTDSLHHIEKCKSVNIDYVKMTYKGNDCQSVSTQEWLTDIPNQY